MRGETGVRTAVCLALLTTLTAKADAQIAPRIFDWSLNQGPSARTDPAVPEIGPVVHNNSAALWSDTDIRETHTYQLAAGKKIAMLFKGDADAPAINDVYVGTPLNGTLYCSDGYAVNKVNGAWSAPYSDPTAATAAFALHPTNDRDTLTNQLGWLSTNIGHLDYVFADFENDSHLSLGENMVDVNTRAMVSQVRAHPNANISSARVGQYGAYPGAFDLSEIAVARIDRTDYWGWQSLGIHSDRNAFYLSSGLNVAMPVLYPYSYYRAHRDGAGYGWNSYPVPGQTFLSPNFRSALFWSPLEKLSVAARNLPTGHELIPWVTDFIPKFNYDIPVQEQPTLEDNEASIKHYRMRGAHGYYAFLPTLMPVATYRLAMNQAWHSLDAQFNRPGALRILNLATNKTGGIDWSGVERGNRVLVLLSNLNTSDQAIDWSSAPQLPVQSPSVAAGTHVLYQYHTPYFNNDNMEKYTSGQAMNNQGAASWQGPNAVNFSASASPGTGNLTARAVTTGPDYARYEAWYSAPSPGFASTDKVVYSAWLYPSSAATGFLPTNTASGTPTSRPAANHQGPLFSINWTTFKIRQNEDNGTSYEAANLAAIANKWYEVQVAVDPSKDMDGVSGGNHGAASVWVRNVTDGQTDFTRLVFDDPATTGTVERMWEVPLQLNAAAARDITNFNGWIVAAYGAGNAIDNLNAGYYVPHMGDNFEHYNPTAADVSGSQGWLSGQSAWRVQSSTGVGNGTSRALTPVVGTTNALGRWRTEPAGFESSDKVIYQGRVNSGNFGAGTASVGFGPVNTVTGGGGYGPFVSISNGALYIRTTRVNGPLYKANISVSPSSWYEVRLLVDPTRDIDGTTGGQYGVGRLLVRNLSAGQTTFTQVVLDDTTTTGAVESLSEIPLWLGVGANVASYDGWEVTGYDSTTQVDGLTVSLSAN